MARIKLGVCLLAKGIQLACVKIGLNLLVPYAFATNSSNH